jgi:hypothetical protein
MSLWKSLVPGAALCLLATTAFAQQLYFYPAHNQTPAAQQQDQFQCGAWAGQQTGFNPDVPPPVVETTPPDVGGPFLFGRIRRAHLLQEEDAMAEQQLGAYNQKKSAYDRAMSACMTGRGYSVS